MTKRILITLLFLFNLCTAQTIRHYAVAHLRSAAVASKVATRFKATGKPLFLIHNTKRGLAEGDFIKFRDKMVLVDGQVWQTLKADGALSNLSITPVTTIRGRSQSSEWTGKANAVGNSRRKKAYTLGAEILKIFENQFKNYPKSEEITIKFSGNRATLVVPNKILNSLALGRVTKTKKSGKFVWITDSLPDIFTNSETLIPIWAADMQEPSSSIKYRVRGTLPAGLNWNYNSHALSGTPLEAGKFPLTFYATSTRGRSISRNVTLEVKKNAPPLWANIPDTLLLGFDTLTIPLLISDLDHKAEDITIKFDSLPDQLTFDSNLVALDWKPTDSTIPLNSFISVTFTDPDNGKNNYTLPISINHDGPDAGYTFATLSPPWDTLTQFESYEWHIGKELLHWRKNHLKMRIQKASDSLTFRDSIITVVPQKAEKLRVNFQYKTRTGEIIDYPIEIPVLKNESPYFSTSPEKFMINQREEFAYAPQAKDPEGGPTTIEVDSLSPNFKWTGDTLYFYTELPGTYNARLSATDKFGNKSEQHITYYVQKISDKPVGITIKHGYWPGLDSWSRMRPLNIMGQTKALRFGVFFPDDGNLFDLDGYTAIGTEKSFRLPFFYVGTQLLPTDLAAKGNSFYTDLGMTYNIFSKDIHTLGFYFNLEFEGISERLFNSLIEARMTFMAKHLMQKVSVNYEEEEDSLGNKTYTYEALKSIDLLEEFISPQNFNIFIDAANWYYLGYGFFIGPSVQIRVAPFAMHFTVNETTNIDGEKEYSATTYPDTDVYLYTVGAGLRHKLKYRKFALDNEIRLGYGGNINKFKVYWDCRLHFGNWKR